MNAQPSYPIVRIIRLMILAAMFVAGGCTYDFDKFAVRPDANVGPNAGSGGAMAGTGGASSGSGGATAITATGGRSVAESGAGSGTGGNVGRDSGAGGNVGRDSGAGGSVGRDSGADGSVVADTGGDVGSCVGAAYGGICWYLGPSGSSCQQTCATHGKPAPEAATYVGDTAQGGSLSECETLLGLLGIKGEPASGTRSDGLGFGCHVFPNSTSYWLSAPSFSPSSSSSGVQVVCGCTQ